jgi:hypothetical protein
MGLESKRKLELVKKPVRLALVIGKKEEEGTIKHVFREACLGN